MRRTLLAAASEVCGRLVRLGAVVAASAAVLALTDIGCVVRLFTGVSCPGCGMTRAWLAALRLDFASALAYHPLFWMAPLIAVLCVVLDQLSRDPGRGAARRARRAVFAALALSLAVVVAVWLARLACPEDAGMLFGGEPPAGVPADIVGVAWLDA